MIVPRTCQILNFYQQSEVILDSSHIEANGFSIFLELESNNPVLEKEHDAIKGSILLVLKF